MAEDGKVTIPGEDFFKSLGKLEALAGRETQEGDDMNKAQLFHTGSNSERTSWPGGAKHDVGNKWDDSIGKDGTDYHPARKAIAEKALKGLPLAPEELAILKGDIETSISKGEGQEVEGKDTTPGPKGEARPGLPFNKAKADEDKDTPDPDERDKAYKSFEAMQDNETVQQGVEVSGFLAEFAKAFGSRMDQIEKSLGDRVVEATNFMLEQVGGYMDSRFEEQGEFNKSLADAVVNIGHGVAGNMEQVQQVAEMPAGPPKSQLQVLPGGAQPMEKSFGGPQGEQLSKGQISEALVDLVQKGQVNPLEVSKYDMTGEIRPDLQDQVVKHIQSGGKQ
jgi:hypothetical protein